MEENETPVALLRVEGLCVDLPGEDGAARRAVDGADVALEPGCVYDLVGRSGSGKSTLLRACARMVAVASGEVFLEGRSWRSFDAPSWRACVCLVPQKPVLVAGNVRDNLLLPWRLAVRRGAAAPSDDEMAEALAAADMADVGLDRDASRLSGGQSARVALVRCLLTRPRVLLMDEVDAALDERSSRAVSAMTASLAAEGACALRVRHRAPDGLARATFLMEEGRVVSHG